MSLLNAALALGKKSPRQTRDQEDGPADATLHIYVSDGGWRAALTNPKDITWQSHETRPLDRGAANSAGALSEVIEKLTDAKLHDGIGKVVLYVDDPDLQLVDHRMARLTNFEPRALKDFGSQQAGGRQVAFGSLAFGSSSSREVERRVLGFIPEDKLKAYFFALGKMAPSLIAVTPAAIGCFTAQPDKAGMIFATLNVHNYFSTLLVANSEIGLIAVRQLPFGAMTVAQAYADAFGIGLAEASDILNRRPRLPPAAAVHGELPAALEHKTASFAALAPNLRMLSNEILATLDYFHFERMGGLPAALSLSFSGPSIAGLDEWLSDALALRVELVQMTPAHLPALLEKAPHFNLLEGSRTGLLKIGNRPFEFMDGRFKPIKGSDPKMRANAKAGISLHSLGNLTIPPEIAKLLSSYGRRYAVPAASCAAFALVTFLNIAFLTSPAKNTLAAHTADYSSAAEQSLQRVAAAKVEASGEVAGDVGQPLWAEHLVSVSQALLPEMRLERMEMNPTGPTLDAAVTLSLFGILPTQSPDNLKLIASFMDRLSEDETFMRKFTAVNFSGADNTNGNTPASMSFQVAATETGAE